MNIIFYVLDSLLRGIIFVIFCGVIVLLPTLIHELWKELRK